MVIFHKGKLVVMGYTRLKYGLGGVGRQVVNCITGLIRQYCVFRVTVTECLVSNPCLSFPCSCIKREKQFPGIPSDFIQSGFCLWTCREQDPPVHWQWRNRTSYPFKCSRWQLVLPNSPSNEKCLMKRKEFCKCGDVERREGTATCNQWTEVC